MRRRSGWRAGDGTSVSEHAAGGLCLVPVSRKTTPRKLRVSLHTPARRASQSGSRNLNSRWIAPVRAFDRPALPVTCCSLLVRRLD